MQECPALTFLVHRCRGSSLWPLVLLNLTADEVVAKRNAILCHETQMALSRRRFTAYARKVIPYNPIPAAAVAAEHHPVEEAEFRDDALRIRVRLSRAHAPFYRVSIAAQSIPMGMVRWSFRLPVEVKPSS